LFPWEFLLLHPVSEAVQNRKKRNTEELKKENASFKVGNTE